MSSRTGRNYRFAAAGIVVTAVAQGLIGSYFAKNAIFFATAALCVPVWHCASSNRTKSIIVAPAMPFPAKVRNRKM
jgi:hypothetical protein